MHYYHIMAMLKEDYQKSNIPGYEDNVDGFNIGCGISIKTSNKKKKTSGNEEKSHQTEKNMKITSYFHKLDNNQPSTSEVLRDETDDKGYLKLIFITLIKII
jgi:hypothetical protein